MSVVLLLFALLGHAFLWVGLVNRLHAVNLPRPLIKRFTRLLFLCAGLIGLGLLASYVGNPQRLDAATWRSAPYNTPVGLLVSAYIALCWAVAAITLVRLAWLRLYLHRTPAVVRFHGRQSVAIDLESAAQSADELKHHPWTRLPRNETLQLELSQWVLDVPRLAPALDRFTISHLSDLHFIDRVGKAYFREVVRASNELQPDLVCITGDIIERDECFDWVVDTLGQLRARYGAYFILGNHDLRVDTRLLRRTLRQHGLVDLGGRWMLLDAGGTPFLLAGNERPWFNGCESQNDLPEGKPGHLLDQGPLESLPAWQADGPLRIVLSHTPDQFGWAQAQQADLLMVGHTHGGQIRIPPFGAIFSPTVRGVKYISGVYYAAPTIMHVTRGISSDIPLRFNCPPEIGHLRLRSVPVASLEPG
jgi:uncharacterized protein